MFHFPPQSRLHNSREYERVWRLGRRYHTENLIIIIAAGTATKTRLGMTVSRKVGNAVCRNRLKRWIREYFRHLPVEALPPLDINIVAKRHAGSISRDKLDQELSSVFQRLEGKKHA